MKKINIIIVSLLFTALIFSVSCDPEDPENNTTPLVFTELTADNDTIYAGETITFNAVASGNEIIYEWQATVGTLLGSGTQVTLTPTPCISGDITVTCTVRDASNNTESKNLTVTILEL